MIDIGTTVKVILPETIQVPTSITGLVMKTIPNESPYKNQIGKVSGHRNNIEKNGDSYMLNEVYLPKLNRTISLFDENLEIIS